MKLPSQLCVLCASKHLFFFHSAFTKLLVNVSCSVQLCDETQRVVTLSLLSVCLSSNRKMEEVKRERETLAS